MSNRLTGNPGIKAHKISERIKRISFNGALHHS